MWLVGRPCPEFQVRTGTRAIDPTALRGRWAAVLHCARPCTPSCAACFDGWIALGERLGRRGCRLIVGLDAPDQGWPADVAERAAGPTGLVEAGTWEPMAAGRAATSLLALVDPGGIVRAVLERASPEPLSAAWLLEALDRVMAGHTELRAPPRERDCRGCVDWFDFERAPRPVGAPPKAPGG